MLKDSGNSKNSGLHCDKRLLHDGDCSEESEFRMVKLREASDCKYLFYIY